MTTNTCLYILNLKNYKSKKKYLYLCPDDLKNT